MAQDLTFKHRGPSDTRAGKKVATTIDAENSSVDTSSDDGPGSEQYRAVEANSDVEPSSSEAEESESTPDKVGLRKPSKKVSETAMNEVCTIDD